MPGTKHGSKTTCKTKTIRVGLSHDRRPDIQSVSKWLSAFLWWAGSTLAATGGHEAKSQSHTSNSTAKGTIIRLWPEQNEHIKRSQSSPKDWNITFMPDEITQRLNRVHIIYHLCIYWSVLALSFSWDVSHFTQTNDFSIALLSK